mmetsp:Transcript_10635/g.19494  ORF Transcript_10635/g.19494 Transcript_10635/m.19494 type:complete len:255 (-) Transcript_10635:1141-1905(-)
MNELIDSFYGFYQVSCHASYQIEQFVDMKVVLFDVVVVVVVLVVAIKNPKTHILVTGRILGIGLKYNLFLWVLGKLFPESFIGRPKQANIRNPVENHGESFQSQSKGPCHFSLVTAIGLLQYFWSHDATSQHFQPFVLPKYFQFQGRMSKRKILVDPSTLRVWSKQMHGESLEGSFQVIQDVLFCCCCCFFFFGIVIIINIIIIFVIITPFKSKHEEDFGQGSKVGGEQQWRRRSSRNGGLFGGLFLEIHEVHS